MKIRTKVVFILWCLLTCVCAKPRKIDKTENVIKENIIPEPPVNYQALTMGFRNITEFTESKDSVEIISMPYTSKDSSSNKVDFMVSIVEVYSKDDSLLYRLEKSGKDVNKVINHFWLETPDSFYVRAWGFCYQLTDDQDSELDSRKLYWATTPLHEYRYPVERETTDD